MDWQPEQFSRKIKEISRVFVVCRDNDGGNALVKCAFIILYDDNTCQVVFDKDYQA